MRRLDSRHTQTSGFRILMSQMIIYFFNISSNMSNLNRNFIFIQNVRLTYLLPVTPLAYRAVTRVLHDCLSLASFWGVPQLLFAFGGFFGFHCPPPSDYGPSSIPFSLWCQEESCLYNAVRVTSQHMAEPMPTSFEDDCGHVLLLTPVLSRRS